MLYAYVVLNRWFALRPDACAECRRVGLPYTAMKRRRVKVTGATEGDL